MFLNIAKKVVHNNILFTWCHLMCSTVTRSIDHTRIVVFVSLKSFLCLSVSPIACFVVSGKLFHSKILPLTKKNDVHLVFQNYSGVPNKRFPWMLFFPFFPPWYCLLALTIYLFLKSLFQKFCCISLLYGFDFRLLNFAISSL